MQFKAKNKIKGPHLAEVLSNIKLSDDTWKLTFRNEIIAKSAKPGQFVSILCEDLLLRRPFSVANSTDDIFEIIFKIKGKGTKYLADLENGDSADIIGPFGNGFNIENKNSLLIGCGVGIAPINFLADRLKESGIKHTFVACSQTYMDTGIVLDRNVTLNLFQGLSNEELSLQSQNEQMLNQVQHDNQTNNSKIIITEDGSDGLKGRLDNHLENIINKIQPQKIYTCGPNAAMAYICLIAEKLAIPVEAALERDFACGTGVCMGCVIQIKENNKIVNKRICKDGPVFRGNEVLW